MSKKPVKISTVLTRAAKWIDEHGLAKGTYFKYRNGRHVDDAWDSKLIDQVETARAKGCKACTWGGIYVGAYEPGVEFDLLSRRGEEAAGYVDVVLNERDEYQGYGIPDWNDAPKRTKEEVVQTLKEAAKAARKDGK